MGVVRIGVRTPRYIKTSCVNDADEIALNFARNEKKRTPSKRVFLWTGTKWGSFDDPECEPSTHTHPDGGSSDMAEYWVFKTDDSGIDERGYDLTNDAEYTEI